MAIFGSVKLLGSLLLYILPIKPPADPCISQYLDTIKYIAGGYTANCVSFRRQVQREQTVQATTRKVLGGIFINLKETRLKTILFMTSNSSTHLY